MLAMAAQPMDRHVDRLSHGQPAPHVVTELHYTTAGLAKVPQGEATYAMILSHPGRTPHMQVSWTGQRGNDKPEKGGRKPAAASLRGPLSPLESPLPIVQIVFKALHAANDALLGVHYITRITKPHFHCFSDPRFGALSPTKLWVHPIKGSTQRPPHPHTPETHFIRPKSSSLAYRLAFVMNRAETRYNIFQKMMCPGWLRPNSELVVFT